MRALLVAQQLGLRRVWEGFRLALAQWVASHLSQSMRLGLRRLVAMGIPEQLAQVQEKAWALGTCAARRRCEVRGAMASRARPEAEVRLVAVSKTKPVEDGGPRGTRGRYMKLHQVKPYHRRAQK